MSNDAGIDQLNHCRALCSPECPEQIVIFAYAASGNEFGQVGNSFDEGACNPRPAGDKRGRSDISDDPAEQCRAK
jgi:hypothetical protein